MFKQIVFLLTFIIFLGAIGSGTSRCNIKNGYFFTDVHLPVGKDLSLNKWWEDYTLLCRKGCFEIGDEAWCECDPNEFKQYCANKNTLAVCKKIIELEDKEKYGIQYLKCERGCDEKLNRCKGKTNLLDLISSFFSSIWKFILNSLGLKSEKDIALEKSFPEIKPSSLRLDIKISELVKKSQTVKISSESIRNYIKKEKFKKVSKNAIISAGKFDYIVFKSDMINNRYLMKFYNSIGNLKKESLFNKKEFLKLRSYALNKGKITNLPKRKLLEEYTKEEISEILEKSIQSKIRKFGELKGKSKNLEIKTRLREGKEIGKYKSIVVEVENLGIMEKGLSVDKLVLIYKDVVIDASELIDSNKIKIIEGKISKKAIVSEDSLNYFYNSIKSVKLGESEIKINNIKINENEEMEINAEIEIPLLSGKFSVLGNIYLKENKIMMKVLKTEASFAIRSKVEEKTKEDIETISLNELVYGFPLPLGSEFSTIKTTESEILMKD